MTKQVIEYAGVPVGISVPEGNSIKFIAVKFPVIELDGGVYNSIGELRQAIGRHLRSSDNANQLQSPGYTSLGNDFRVA